MKIAVCIKQVPTREWQPRLDDSKTWIREADASFEMNEPDAYALEEALRLKEKHSGEVVVCSAGPARVAQVIREALARGADRAIHVEGDQLASADAFVTAAALAAAMKDEKFDLTLTGLQSDDQGFAQVGVILAEKLGLPHATIIMEVQAEGSSLRVKRSPRASSNGGRAVVGGVLLGRLLGGMLSRALSKGRNRQAAATAAKPRFYAISPGRGLARGGGSAPAQSMQSRGIAPPGWGICIRKRTGSPKDQASTPAWPNSRATRSNSVSSMSATSQPSSRQRPSLSKA